MKLIIILTRLLYVKSKKTLTGIYNVIFEKLTLAFALI